MNSKAILLALGLLLAAAPLLTGQEEQDPDMTRMLLRLLEHENGVLASHAASELQKIGPEVIPMMVTYFDRASKLLEKQYRKAEELVEALDAGEIPERDAARKALVEMADLALPALTRAAKGDGSAELLAQARAAIRIIRKSEKISPNTRARRSAVKIVCSFSMKHPGKVIPFLVDRLTDPDIRVKSMSHSHLGWVTGQHMDATPKKWSRWWEANREKIKDDPEYLKSERERIVKRLVFTLRDGTVITSSEPKKPLVVVTGFGRLTIPWSKLLRFTARNAETYEIVTKQASFQGAMEPAFRTLALEDDGGETEIATNQIRSINWVTLSHSRATLNAGHHLIVGCARGVVQELDGDNRVVWSYTARNPYSAQRLPNGNTLMSFYTAGPIREVDASGKTVWQYKAGGPVDAKQLRNGNVLIADYTGRRVIEVDRSGTIVWQKAVGGNPYEADRLANGNTLVAINGAGRVAEFDPSGKEVWKVTGVGQPVSADRLRNGNTLIAETGGRVLEVDVSGKVVWKKTGLQGPYDAHRLPNGNTIIAQYNGASVIEVDPSGTTVKTIKFQNPMRVIR